MGGEPFPAISMLMGIMPKPEKRPAKHTQIKRMCHTSFSDLGDLHYIVRPGQGTDLRFCLEGDGADRFRKSGTVGLGWARGWWIS